METKLEEMYVKDSYLQSKIQELANLKSELMLMYNPGLPNFDNYVMPLEKDEQDPEVTKKDALLRKIGKDLFEVLRKIFLKYSSLKDYFNIRKLDSLTFHKFLEDSDLYSNLFTKVSADLVFHKSRSTNSIDFWKFVEVLIKISRIYYVNEKKYQSLVSLITQKMIPKLKYYDENEVFVRYHSIFQETDIKNLINSRKNTLKAAFLIFKSTDSGDMEFVPNALRSKRKGNKIERVLRITLKGFINFLTAFEFLPDLISGFAAAKLFRAVPCPLLFNECLDYSEFTEACFYTALHIYESQSYKEFCQRPYECVEMWFKFFDAHPKPLIQNQNPLRNTVYTLQQDIDYS